MFIELKIVMFLVKPNKKIGILNRSAKQRTFLVFEAGFLVRLCLGFKKGSCQCN
jgi:hypothetical protein